MGLCSDLSSERTALMAPSRHQGGEAARMQSTTFCDVNVRRAYGSFPMPLPLFAASRESDPLLFGPSSRRAMLRERALDAPRVMKWARELPRRPCSGALCLRRAPIRRGMRWRRPGTDRTRNLNCISMLGAQDEVHMRWTYAQQPYRVIPACPMAHAITHIFFAWQIKAPFMLIAPLAN